jgi:subfamily B ATP-binding cassette protein MsbA
MTDIGMVQNLLTGETLGMLASVIALIFSLVMAFFLNWKLSPILLGMILLYVLNYRLCSLRIRRANLELRDIMDQVTGRLQERIAGVRLVKTYCRERDETGHFLASTNRALEQSFRGDMLTVYMNIGARLISGIGATCIFGGACWYVLRHQMGYGDVTALMTYVWQAINPAVSLTMLAGTITQALVSLDRVIEIFQWQPEVTERPDAVELDTAHGDITLDNVFFSYKEDKPLFQGFTYHIAAGKMTALVGHTGCGKTTITSLIMRLWDVQDGRVTLDGHDVRDLTLRSLRKHIGVVPQEPVVFEGTAFDNIAYALPDATPAQVEEAARAAQIHDFISALPDGYHTWFGKEGAKLSVGEKQRIAIARAMLRKPAVLILDEATSSLDSESEAALQEALHVVLHGRTSVVVAHRLSTIVQADQIVAMDNGRIIEVGTHDALMRVDGGYYRKLYEELKGMHTVEEAAG